MVAARHNATPAQIALAWLLAQKPWIVPLFGTRKLERFEENVVSLDVFLPNNDLAEIRSTVESISVIGTRYPAEMLQLSGR